MSLRRTREHLKVQILETERMAQGVEDHPLMSLSFMKRLESLKAQLAQMPVSAKEPTVSLLFSGKPVHGSIGIDASFIGKALIPFQKMVHADLVQRGYGKVGNRGQLKSSEDAKLFLTALPRGSFGVELSKVYEGQLFNEDLVSDSLSQVSKLIEASAKSDEDFATSLQDVSLRTVQGLKDFLKAVSHDEAGVTVESGGIRASLRPEEVAQAYTRVAETTSDEDEVKIKGTLRGILLESWRFDFQDENHNTITGTLNPDLTEDQVTQFFAQFFNQSCEATFQKTTVYLRSGRLKESYVLKAVASV